MSDPLLPLELLGLIIDSLAHEGGRRTFPDSIWGYRVADPRSLAAGHLKNCALVSRAFLSMCRKHLLETILVSIQLPYHTNPTRNLMALLQKSPEVADYVRHLHLYVLSEFQPFPTELKTFSKLESCQLSFTRGYGVDDWIHLNGLAELLLPSVGNIKEIKISVDGIVDVEDPLYGLCEELEILGNLRNVLETLTFDLKTYLGINCTTGDEWGKLDQVIDRFAWPMLKKIHLSVETKEMADEQDDGTADFKRSLDVLPAKQFPKLLAKSRNDLDFQFVVRPSFFPPSMMILSADEREIGAPYSDSPKSQLVSNRTLSWTSSVLPKHLESNWNS